MSDATAVRRRLPVGAEIVPGLGVHFRIWAPAHRQVALVLGREAPELELPLAREGDGYFSGVCAQAEAGSAYRFRLDADQALYPDPASRSQPDGPHGASRVVDPSSFRWHDGDWPGAAIEGQIVYEMHVGTFTPEGTWRAAIEQFRELRDVGITVLEVMPVAEFPGRFGWGYDGVDLFAPTRLYGSPDDFRRFVDEAHRAGLAVILDVVYNHFGPDGAYFKAFSTDYFTDRHANEWGEAINFDGEGSGPVREFFLANARYWVEEFHLDGLRLDATQTIHDDSPEHIVKEVAAACRRAAAPKPVILIAENEPQETRIARPVAEGGYGLDALWNDDFHHSALVALTGHNDAYYTDYLGVAQEFVSAAKYGYLYQGQRYAWQKKSRGTPAWGLGPASFVAYLENHDQVANSACGMRLHQLTSPGRYRAMTALLLLGPETPMLFQGQEFASSRPFVYFADHTPELARAVREGRFEFLSQFSCIASQVAKPQLADPSALETFEQCRLDLDERRTHRFAYHLHRDLLRLRREDPAFRRPRRGALDGAVLTPQAFVLRFFAESGHQDDRLLVVNLGRDLRLRVAPEPLLAPPEGKTWRIAWSSDDPRYGGQGVPALLTDDGMRLAGEAAVVLVASQPERDGAGTALVDSRPNRT